MPYLSCGRCIACRKGKPNCCTQIQVLGVHRDGAFAEYLSVPEPFVHKVEGVTLDQAAMVEFLAIGAHAVRRAQVQEGHRVLVVGAGPIGMGAILLNRARIGSRSLVGAGALVTRDVPPDVTVALQVLLALRARHPQALAPTAAPGGQ